MGRNGGKTGWRSKQEEIAQGAGALPAQGTEEQGWCIHGAGQGFCHHCCGAGDRGAGRPRTQCYPAHTQPVSAAVVRAGSSWLLALGLAVSASEESILVTLGRIRNREASQPRSSARRALLAHGAPGRNGALQRGAVSLRTVGLSSLVPGPSPREVACHQGGTALQIHDQPR